MGILTSRTIRILLIDDEETIRDSVRLSLHDQNILKFEIYEAGSSEEGFEQAKRIIPDTIILDLHLPEKSGFEFMDLMNGQPTLAHTQVIMLTGDDTPSNMFEADSKHINPFRFISKPFDVNVLQSAVFGTAIHLSQQLGTSGAAPQMSECGAC